MARMARHAPRTHPALFALLIVAGLLAAGLWGCDGEEAEPPRPRETASRPAPPASDFPAADGRELGEVIDDADPPRPSDPVATSLTQVFEQGDNRYSLLLADRDRHEITDAEVALYIAPIPAGGKDAYKEPARGPFPARLVSLGTEPEFRSDSTLDNPYSATAYYSIDLPFPATGDWRVEALIRQGDRLIAKSLPRASVGAYKGVPGPGQRPPEISTPTPESVAGDLSRLTTRRPPSSQNEVSFADVLGERPVALLFTTPGFCQSRICGPVSDVAEQVGSEFAGQAEVIQMEIYKNNHPDEGVRRQVRRFNLPSDTWLFVMGADGVVRKAVEGPFGVDEMRSWLEEASRR